MEKGSMIGLALAFVGVFLGAIMKGADPVALFVNIPAILIVWIGSIGAVMISHPFSDTQNVGKYVQKAIKGDEEHSASETIGQIVKLTNRARAEGLPGLVVCSASTEVPQLVDLADVVVDGPAGVVELLGDLVSRR